MNHINTEKVSGARAGLVPTFEATGLQFVLSEGVPQEKLVDFRQCVEIIVVDKSAERIGLAIHFVPVANLQAV